MSQYSKWPIVSGGGGGSGTVTSVGLAAPAMFLVSGSPVTTAGSLVLSLATQAANIVFAGPTSGGAAAPTFRSLVSNDIPSLLASKISDFQTTVSANTDVAANTVARHVAVTIGTANGLSLVGQALSMALASGSTTGALSSADFTTFNNKQSALTFGNLTEATSAVLTILGGTGAVIGSGSSIQVKQASPSQSGYLSAADFVTFSSGLSSGNIDGGSPSTIYGGNAAINGGTP